MSDENCAAAPDSDFVILKCPACAAAEPIQAAILAEGSQIVVCRRCGETWTTGNKSTAENGGNAISPKESRALACTNPPIIEALKRPLASYGDGNQDAWAARIAADRTPAPAGPTAARSFFAAVAALASTAFLVAFFAGRESAVAAVPDLAGLYEAIGLPVNLQGLAIDDLAGRRQMAGDGARLTVSGALVNLRSDEQPVPDLIVELRDSANQPLRSLAMAPPVARLAGLDSKAFQFDIDDVPKAAVGVAVRFAASGDTRPDAGGSHAILEPSGK